MNRICQLFPPERLDATVDLPPSKSLAAREMTLRALASQALASPGDACEDLRVLERGLRATSGTVDVAQSGTALRLLAAYHAAREGSDVVITGSARLGERPLAPLIDALRSLGAEIYCLSNEGHAPIHVVGRPLARSATVTIDASQSSQFVTALMLIAPTLGGMTIRLKGDPVSRPYIDMTLGMLRRHGVGAVWTGDSIRVEGDSILPAPDPVEGDWSAAAFWLALPLLIDGRVTLRGLSPDTLQGDCRCLTLLEQWGLGAVWNADGSLTATRNASACCCCSSFADLLGTPDLAPILVTALCLLGRPFRITGLRTLRLKESNRTEALADLLASLGYRLTLEGDDAVSWHFATCPAEPDPILDPRDDHRLAMALALAAVKHPGLRLLNPDCTGKSYPAFWRHLRQAGFRVE